MIPGVKVLTAGGHAPLVPVDAEHQRGPGDSGDYVMRILTGDFEGK